MEKKLYLIPGIRIIPMTALEAFCASSSDFDGGVPDYDPVEGFQW